MALKPSEPKVALIDADFLVYRIGFASKNDEELYAKSRLKERLFDIVYHELRCDDYLAWITGKGNYRDAIAVTQPYKGNRVGLEKPPHYAALREYLQRLGATVTEGEEADDAVAIESAKGNYWIVHQDKDLDQLPGWHYNPVKQEKYYLTDFEASKNFWTQMLVGDRTDHIRGLKGIGPKKAAKALKDCTSEDDLRAAVKQAYEKAGEPLERLIENGRLLWLRRTEGELWDLPVETK